MEVGWVKTSYQTPPFEVIVSLLFGCKGTRICSYQTGLYSEVSLNLSLYCIKNTALNSLCSVLLCTAAVLFDLLRGYGLRVLMYH